MRPICRDFASTGGLAKMRKEEIRRGKCDRHSVAMRVNTCFVAPQLFLCCRLQGTEAKARTFSATEQGRNQPPFVKDNDIAQVHEIFYK